MTLRSRLARLQAGVITVAAAISRQDVVLLLALGLIGYGLSRWSVAGACLVMGGILLALAWPRSSAGEPPERRVD